MAPAYVQGNSNVVFSGTTVAVTLNGVAAGNVLVGLVSWSNVGITLDLVDDNQSEPQAYTLVDNNLNDESGTSWRTGAYYNYNVVGGNTTVTAHFSGTPTDQCITIHEVSGLLITDPLDVHLAHQDVLRSATCTDCLTSGAVVTNQDGEYIFGATGSLSSPGLAAGTNFNLRVNPGSRQRTEDLIQSSAGSIAATFSRTNTTSARENIYILTFKPAASGDIITQQNQWNVVIG